MFRLKLKFQTIDGTKLIIDYPDTLEHLVRFEQNMFVNEQNWLNDR